MRLVFVQTAMNVRRTVYYAGRVQGVGFRFTAVRAARGLDVTGYVRNLSDGRVELVVEGPAEQVQMLLDRIEREMAGYIRETHVSEGPATGEFGSFDIRF